MCTIIPPPREIRYICPNCSAQAPKGVKVAWLEPFVEVLEVPASDPSSPCPGCGHKCVGEVIPKGLIQPKESGVTPTTGDLCITGDQCFRIWNRWGMSGAVEEKKSPVSVCSTCILAHLVHTGKCASTLVSPYRFPLRTETLNSPKSNLYYCVQVKRSE